MDARVGIFFSTGLKNKDFPILLSDKPHLIDNEVFGREVIFWVIFA